MPMKNLLKRARNASWITIIHIVVVEIEVSRNVSTELKSYDLTVLFTEGEPRAILKTRDFDRH